MLALRNRRLGLAALLVAIQPAVLAIGVIVFAIGVSIRGF
jgi:hypothetical protein